MKVVLDVLTGPHQGTRFEFDRHATFLVGRAAGAHLRLADDRYFSRHHFLMEMNPPRCYLRDLGSTNGTLVNDRRVREAYLGDGDLIEGGMTRIRLTLPDGPPPAAAPPPATDGPPPTTDGPAPAASATGPAPTASKSRPAPAGDARADAVPPVHGYEVVRKLGQGGMGAVYLARQQATGRHYALKFIVPESASSDRAMALFLREVSVLSRLDHPRIVRFHEMGIAQGQFYFAMEYVPTVDHRSILGASPGRDRIRAACLLMCHVLAGVGHAHERGFVHRDIKPSNILVGLEGAKWSVKLADFGLAKSFENAGFSGMTRDGAAVGTLSYMAPEQVIDARRATPSVDVYSIGATLYSLIADRPPHDPRLADELILAILEREPEPLDRLNPAVPRELARIVAQALAIDPADRFATAADLRAALRPFAKPGP
ncbi:Serine/threonine-protein kinase PrkC [Aquisphaera giovannonii]|uniref:Serine/threonine-protein kinase PrkC n=1 Tax=Aquisphaera giovannonii TaxID=406548 RepID=A0A5B9W4X5_9BACT|nr:FHA domain-containing serine/threonine-protein kinase [Aquisphaera giovannonii]QEH35215.1 Serine/threonine-protein kinase PrkC [Aquisphaera giovannonii]